MDLPEEEIPHDAARIGRGVVVIEDEVVGDLLEDVSGMVLFGWVGDFAVWYYGV